MSKLPITFSSFYQTRLQEKLAKLNRAKTPALIATGYMRVVMVAFFIIFFSIFLGFISMFPMEGVFIWVIRCFMILAAFIILFGNIRKYVYQDLKNFFPYFAQSRANVNVITVASIILMMVGSTYLGMYYLGGEFGFGFIGRYAGAIGVLAVMGISTLFVKGIADRFQANYKGIVLPEVLNYLDTDASYSPDDKIEQDEFLQSQFFQPQSIHKYLGSDLVKAQRGQTIFGFSQLEVQEFKKTVSRGQTKTEIVEIFKGLFYVSEFNKPLKGHTLVLPDVARELFGEGIGEKLNRLGMLGYEDVKFEQLENVQFEKYFTVYSSDPIEARYILSPSLMEKILNLRKQLNLDYSLSFKDNKMYLIIESPKDLFGPDMFSSVDNKERAEAISQFLEKILGITETFGLNTRIWTA